MAVPALAQGTGPAPPVSLRYAGYAAGLNVMQLQATAAITPQRYQLSVGFHLSGLVGFVVSGGSTTTVDGEFRGTTPEPRELFSTGEMHGRPRVTQIDWQGGNPVVLQLVPPVEEERDQVPTAEQAHTIDTLSAMAALLNQVATTGRCDGAMTTFDGRRLSSIQSHTVGEETLPETGRSSFQGTALRCDFEGRQLAGFLRDADQDALRRPQQGSAWFAPLTPGAAPVPVRIRFHARNIGMVTLYLVQPS